MSTYQPLVSSVLAGYVYDEKTQRLEVFIRYGHTRIFKGVPKATVARLAKAKSAGRFYMTHIRSRYGRVKLEREEAMIQAPLPAMVNV